MNSFRTSKRTPRLAITNVKSVDAVEANNRCL
jgi:hypothetical protein